jgi:LAGLIDADG endonuclease
LVFQITQHTRDEELLQSFINYFGCGRYRERLGGLAGDFNVSKLSDITEKILPFFEKYPILGVKAKDF